MVRLENEISLLQRAVHRVAPGQVGVCRSLLVLLLVGGVFGVSCLHQCTPAALALGLSCHSMASALEELQKDLEEVKVLLGKSTRKRQRDTLASEKPKIETELKNKMQQKSQKKPELDNEKPDAMVAPLTTGYTMKISNYGRDQSDKFVKIYITLTGVPQVPTENVHVHFTERSFDLLVKNLNGKNYSMIMNNLLKTSSVESSSKKKSRLIQLLFYVERKQKTHNRTT